MSELINLDANPIYANPIYANPIHSIRVKRFAFSHFNVYILQKMPAEEPRRANPKKRFGNLSTNETLTQKTIEPDDDERKEEFIETLGTR